MTKFAIDTDEPVLVLVIPLGKTRPSVPPPRKCGPKLVVDTTHEEIAPVLPIRRTA